MLAGENFTLNQQVKTADELVKIRRLLEAVLKELQSQSKDK